jgi:mRNA-degrading endonuclease YafQ of YafQ-DinJ toxin-antitoxin module
MEILQTGRFKRFYKKLHQNQLSEANAALQTIIDNPKIGEQKKGDLSWLRVYKFQMVNQLTLIGYCVEPEFAIELPTAVTLPVESERRLTFVDIGSHENFYRDIKKEG